MRDRYLGAEIETSEFQEYAPMHPLALRSIALHGRVGTDMEDLINWQVRYFYQPDST